MAALVTTASALRVADLNTRKALAFEIRPDAAALAALAQDVGVLGVRKLLFSGEISAMGKTGWEVSGHLGSTVSQPCVVTLEPVQSRIETPVTRRFVAGLDLPEPDDEGELEMPEDDSTDPLGDEIDLGMILHEALLLVLPLYPRAPGAALDAASFTEPGKEAMTDEQARPFAGLAGLRDKLAEKGGQNDE